jgi:hypothetical protein
MPVLRLVGKDLTVLSFGTLNFLALYERFTLELETEFIDVSAVKDEWEYSAVRIKRWRVSGRRLVESDPFEFPKAVAEASELTPLTVTCTVTLPGTNTTKTFTGSAVPEGSSFEAEAAPIHEELRLRGLGAPTFS